MSKKWKDRLTGGLADSKKPEDFDSKALTEGVKVELEHTDDAKLATEIAMDHLTEDPDYYKKLKMIEDKSTKIKSIVKAKLAVKLKKSVQNLPVQLTPIGKDEDNLIVYNYTNFLPTHLRKEYKLLLSSHMSFSDVPENGTKRLLGAAVLYKKEVIGSISGFYFGNGLIEPHLEVEPEHTRKGLGTALHEAMMAHSYHVFKIKGYSPSWFLTEEGKALRTALADDYDLKINFTEVDDQEFPYRASEMMFEGGLAKSEEVLGAYLGVEPVREIYLKAARFLSSNPCEIDDAEYRKNLYFSNNKPDCAALMCYGMPPTSEAVDAIRSVASLMSYSDSQVVKGEVHVHHLTPSSEEVAESVKNAYQNGLVVPVKLQGKHSKGSYLAQDGDKVWLLKPGYGSQSAALGEKEEKASQSQREVAFWQAMHIMGICSYVPHSELISVNGKEYAAIELVSWDHKSFDFIKKEDPYVSPKILQPYVENGDLFKWAFADYVLGNPDRHANNMLVDDHTIPADIKLIDHGSAFAGSHFDPYNDTYSFIPFYFRCWTSSFSELDKSGQLSSIPVPPHEVEHALTQWVLSIDIEKLSSVISQYNIDVKPVLDRIAKVKLLMGSHPTSSAIKYAWLDIGV